MGFSAMQLLELVGALGFFIYGMKVMSEGIQKVAGSRMRSILSVMASNRVLGVMTGFLITSLLQSSSATTVMVVSFVNAGLLTLVESVSVIMGANIGTTITAWLISIFGFKVKIATIALPIIAIGFPMLFVSRGNWKSWAEVIIGFALLFMGLDALKHSVPDLKSNPEVLEFLAHYADMGMLSTLIFIGVGTILTLVVQSSSAAMALTLVMCNQGWIPFELAAAMVLGENIGTTITANLAALIGNVHAKRAARAHFVFNVFGVVWMILVFQLFLSGVDSFMVSTSGVSPLDPEQYESIPIALSLFHTSFNIINVLLLIGFVPIIVKIAIKMVPSRGDLDEETKLEYIGTGILSTPELSIVEAKKEIAKFGKITQRLFGFTTELLELDDKKEFPQQMRRIAKYEDITDKMEIEIADYLSKVSQGELSEHLAMRVRGMLSIVNDLERVGDICYQMSKAVERKREQNSEFNESQRENMLKIYGAVQDAIDTMVENLGGEYSQVNIRNAELLEVEINNLRDTLRSAHLQSIAKAEYSFESGMFYNDLFSSCEKLGDHIFNVNEAVVGIK